MRLIARVGATLSAVVLAAGMASVAGAGPAAAATCNYPPGQCMIGFDHGTYYPPTTANFHAGGHPFHHGQPVHGRLSCTNGTHHGEGRFHANRHGNVNGSIHVGHHQRGTCTFTLTTLSGSHSASGSYHARRHHHSSTSGGSTGGGSVQGGSVQSGTVQSSSSNGATVLGTTASRPEAAAASNLPFTGSNAIAPMSALGSALVLIGGGLLIGIRRRRHAAANSATIA